MNSLRGLLLVAAPLLLALPGAASAHSDTGGFADDHHHHAAAQPVPGAEADWPLVAVSPRLVGLAAASNGPTERRVSAFGRVVPSAGAVHDLNAYISGQVREVFVQPGTWVEEGELVASVYSPEFMLTQSAYLALLQNKEQREQLRQEGRLPNYMRDARENLHWWGMSEQDIEALEARGQPVDSLRVRADQAGVITEVFVEPGQLINAGDRAMQNFLVVGVAVARMAVAGAPLWLEGYTYVNELARLHRREAVAHIHAPDGRVLTKPVAHVAPMVDEDSQLGRFIVPLGEDHAGLALGQVARVDLTLPADEGVWLPRAAVLTQGLDPVAFVQRAAGEYERRRLRVQEAVADHLRVEGVAEGEQVVTEGKMLLEGAYRMGRAGVAADDHHHH